MANDPFSRTIINEREKPLSKDVNRLQSELDRALRHFARQMLGGGDAFLYSGLKVVAQSPAAMAVDVNAGLGFQNDVSDVPSDINSIIGLNDLESFKPLPLLSAESFSVPTAPVSPNTRIDIIEVRADRLITDPESRQILDTTQKKFVPTVVDKTLEWILDGKTGTVVSPVDSTAALSYKQGVAANPGVAPSVSPGYVKLAEIAVGSGVTTITTSDITDSRSRISSLDGSGDVFHGDRQISVSALDAVALQGAHNLNLYWTSTASVQEHNVPLPLRVGDRIKKILWLYHNDANPGSDKDFGVWQLTPTDGSGSPSGGWLTGWVISHTGSPSATQVVEQDGTDYIIQSDEQLFLKFQSGGISDRFYSALVTYDRPR